MSLLHIEWSKLLVERIQVSLRVRPRLSLSMRKRSARYTEDSGSGTVTTTRRTRRSGSSVLSNSSISMTMSSKTLRTAFFWKHSRELRPTKLPKQSHPTNRTEFRTRRN